MADTRNTFTKMKNGKWGVRINGSSMPEVGETIVIEKRNGDTVLATIAEVLWHGIARNGHPASLVTIERDRRPRGSYDAGRDEYAAEDQW